MEYKEEFLKNWNIAGGLITKVTAARIFGVNKSVFSKKKVTIYKIGESEFLSLAEILKMEIKPRQRKKKSQ